MKFRNDRFPGNFFAKINLWRWQHSTAYDERKLLKYLINNSLSESLNDRVYWITNEPYRENAITECCDKDGIMTVKLIGSHWATMKRLVADGYMLPPVSRYDAKRDAQDTKYELTDAGRYFFENRRKRIVTRLIDGVTLPIIVAFVTTLLTLLIAGKI